MNRSSRFLRLPLSVAIAAATPHALAVDQAPAQVLATQRYCAAPDLPVPESSTPLEVRLTVPDSGTITDVDLELMTTHEHAGDLTVRLVRSVDDNDSTMVTLLDHSMGMPPNDIGCQGNFPHLTFDDEGTNGPAQERCNQFGPAFLPPGGRLQPLQALSTFDGFAARGRYDIIILDPFPGDPGIVQKLCLEVTTVGPDRIFSNGFE